MILRVRLGIPRVIHKLKSLRAVSMQALLDPMDSLDTADLEAKKRRSFVASPYIDWKIEEEVLLAAYRRLLATQAQGPRP